MDYNAPYGSIDPDAPYVDRSSPDAIQGSKVPRKAVEHPQREIVNVIVQSGLTPDGNDPTQLWQALKILLTQNPVYPECLNSNGKFDVSSPSAGTVRVPAGIEWVIRGTLKYATAANVDLPTLPNKTYHLRWDRQNLFRLRDLADAAYNPTTALETNSGFDSAYDDVLIARVTTNGANAATITNLINKPKLATMQTKRLSLSAALDWTVRASTAIPLNWARTPLRSGASLSEYRCFITGPDGTQTPSDKGIVLNIGVRVSEADPPTRYQVNDFEYYYEDTQYGTANSSGAASVLLIAEAD